MVKTGNWLYFCYVETPNKGIHFYIFSYYRNYLTENYEKLGGVWNS